MSIAALNHIKARWGGLLPSDKLVLSAIAERTNKSRVSWPSRKVIASDTGLSLDTVKRSLKRLVEKQLIHRSERRNETGCCSSSLTKIVGFGTGSEVGAARTQGWVQANPHGGCNCAPTVGAACPPLYKDEPKREPKEEPKRKVRAADACGQTSDPIPLEAKSLNLLEAFKSYNQTAEQVGLPIARSLTPGRRKSISSRLGEHGAESWDIVLDNIRCSAFLQGHNDRNWRPTGLDWFLKPENYAKVFEGAYNNRIHTKTRNPNVDEQIRMIEALA